MQGFISEFFKIVFTISYDFDFIIKFYFKTLKTSFVVGIKVFQTACLWFFWIVEKETKTYELYLFELSSKDYNYYEYCLNAEKENAVQTIKLIVTNE